jgi:hypothetical protein
MEGRGGGEAQEVADTQNNIFKPFIFLKYTQWQCILSFDNSTAMYNKLKSLTPCRGFEAKIFCS